MEFAKLAFANDRTIVENMQYTYLICYDICDPKRLRQVAKAMCDWGQRLQYSVFECQLSQSERVKIQDELAAIIHHTEDQVLFVRLGPTENRGDRIIETIGKPYTNIDRSSFII